MKKDHNIKKMESKDPSEAGVEEEVEVHGSVGVEEVEVEEWVEEEGGIKIQKKNM